MPSVILSDGLPCEVKILPLYALDHVGPKDPGEFTYWIKTLSGEMQQPYDLTARLENPPKQPDPNTDDTWALTEWERFQGAIVHNRERYRLAEERAGNVAMEVLRLCLDPKDRDRILIEADYEAVYLAGVAQEITGEALADNLRDFFQGQIFWPGDFSGARALWTNPEGRPDRLPGISGMGSRVDDEAQFEPGGLFNDTDERESAANMFNEVTGLDGSPASREALPGTETLTASMLMYEARHGRLYHPSMQGWLFYYAAQQQLKREYARALVLDAQLQLGQAQMDRIMAQAQTADTEKRKELLKQALNLRAQMKRTAKVLNASKF